MDRTSLTLIPNFLILGGRFDWNYIGRELGSEFNCVLSGVLSPSPRKLVEFCWALSSGLLSPSTNTITNFTNAAVLFALLLPYHFNPLKILSLTNSLFCADTSIDGYVSIKITPSKYEFEQHSVLRDTLEPAVSLFVFYLASTTLLEKYEFKQRPVLIDALEPAVSLFVFYPVSTSLLEECLGSDNFQLTCKTRITLGGSQTWSNKICVNDAFDKMHWSLSTTLMKLVGILVEVYFYLLPAPLLYQYSCFVCSFISISFSASDSLTQQLLILCRYFSRWSLKLKNGCLYYLMLWNLPSCFNSVFSSHLVSTSLIEIGTNEPDLSQESFKCYKFDRLRLVLCMLFRGFTYTRKYVAFDLTDNLDKAQVNLGEFRVLYSWHCFMFLYEFSSGYIFFPPKLLVLRC
ncbi:hypothetical protein NC653_006357 [Populus alba x Populus x berolinensis]|uniref:Uncharacterized protein n=1 Tax=Populus alba x Populus x berolinensis TaxID=444605 RepID=A0AAD6WCZ7_9ROSI|nr:hypothetical protein NC653_006357 [Populus alba x Populus x berolinensis]